jgi:hypothetical protein
MTQLHPKHLTQGSKEDITISQRKEKRMILLHSLFSLLHILPMEFISGTCGGQSRNPETGAAKEFLQHTIMNGQGVSVNMDYSIKTKSS